MLNVLLISREDICRSRLAQAVLESLGRGLKFTTAGVSVPHFVPDKFITAMRELGLDISTKSPVDAAELVDRHWDCVIALCPEAELYVKELGITAKFYYAFQFPDVSSSLGTGVDFSADTLSSLHDLMYRELYRFHRDVLTDLVMPMCTCGANTYCRCE